MMQSRTHTCATNIQHLPFSLNIAYFIYFFDRIIIIG